MSRHRASSSSNTPRIWFLSPVAISLAVAAASILPTVLIGDAEFRSLWRTPKAITAETLLMFSSGVLALCFGALVSSAVLHQQPSGTRWPAFSSEAVALLRRASTLLTALTLVGYTGFVFLILRSGLSVSQLTGDNYTDGPPVRDLIGSIPGVTTLTQCGMAAVVVSSLLLSQQYSRGEVVKMMTVIGLSIPRAFIYSERLAIMEVVVPVVAVFCARLSLSSGSKRLAAQLAPAVGIPFVATIFGVFEYFRSWSYFRTRTNNSFIEFTLDRLAGYYTTALNNGHLILHHLNVPGRWPYDTIEWFWNAPGVASLQLYTRLTGLPKPYSAHGETSPVMRMLNNYASPEFNNPCGYTGPFIDYGLVGGLIYFLVIGVVVGSLYRGFCGGRPFGILLYPIMFTGLLELPRYMYWAQGRTLPTLIALITLSWMLNRIGTKSQAAAPLAPMLSPLGS